MPVGTPAAQPPRRPYVRVARSLTLGVRRQQTPYVNTETADRLFSALAAQYRDRKVLAERAVSSWRWASGPWFDPRPLYFERHNDRPGRLLKKPPARPTGRVEVGFDAAGRVVVEREHNEFGCYENFYHWEASPVEVARYHYHDDKDPINLLVLSIDEQRLCASYLVAERGWVREEYVWEGPRLSEVHVSHAPRVGAHYLQLEALHVARAVYDGEQLARVALEWPPKPPSRPERVVEIAWLRSHGI